MENWSNFIQAQGLSCRSYISILIGQNCNTNNSLGTNGIQTFFLFFYLTLGFLSLPPVKVLFFPRYCSHPFMMMHSLALRCYVLFTFVTCNCRGSSGQTVSKQRNQQMAPMARIMWRVDIKTRQHSLSNKLLSNSLEKAEPAASV